MALLLPVRGCRRLSWSVWKWAQMTRLARLSPSRGPPPHVLPAQHFHVARELRVSRTWQCPAELPEVPTGDVPGAGHLSDLDPGVPGGAGAGQPGGSHLQEAGPAEDTDSTSLLKQSMSEMLIRAAQMTAVRRLHLPPVLELLRSHGLTQKQIQELIQHNAALLDHPVDKWEIYVLSMKRLGFGKQQYPVILQSCPDLLVGGAYSLSQVESVIHAFRTVGLKDGNIQTVITSLPKLLHLKPQAIVTRSNWFMQYFTHKEVVRLLVSSPGVLFDGCDDLEEKLVYVSGAMGVSSRAMLRAGVLGYSLQHVRSRHLFLERAGLYQRPDKQGLTPPDQPSLRQVVTSSEATFARRLAGLTVAEYRAFLALLQMEEDVETHSDSEDDTGDDAQG